MLQTKAEIRPDRHLTRGRAREAAAYEQLSSSEILPQRSAEPSPCGAEIGWSRKAGDTAPRQACLADVGFAVVARIVGGNLGRRHDVGFGDVSVTRLAAHANAFCAGGAVNLQPR
jgi:hypothetical protein